MLASLVRLVLALTLAFNGISAPMAMAHGGHGSQSGADIAANPHASHHAGHGVPAHEDHQHGHALPAAGDVSPPDELAGAGCCDGPECRCGCILPPAMPLSGAVAVRHALPQLAPAESIGGSPSIALAAPFRPPSS